MAALVNSGFKRWGAEWLRTPESAQVLRLLDDGLDEIAVNADICGAAGADMKVGAVLVDQDLKQFLECHYRSFLTFMRR